MIKTIAQEANHDFSKGSFRIFNDDGIEIYYENTDGYWDNVEFDKESNETFYENSWGFWIKRKFDDDGNMIYYEDSDGTIKNINISLTSQI